MRTVREGDPTTGSAVVDGAGRRGAVRRGVVVAAVLTAVASTGCGGRSAGAARSTAQLADPGAPRLGTTGAMTAAAEGSPGLSILPDPASTVVAAAVVVPGSAWELPGTAGLTILTARALLEQVRPRLAAVGAWADVECGRAAFTFRLVAPASAGDTALAVLLEGLFRPRITEEAVRRSREALTATLVLDATSPAWQARLAGRQALYGDTVEAAAWAAPACGVPEMLERFDTAWIRAGAYRFLPERATVAVTGRLPRPTPADGGEAGPDGERRIRELVRRWLGPAPRPPLPSPSTVKAGRRYVERNTVTAWLTVAWPFAADADIEAVRILAALLEASVAPSLERPDVFDAEVEVTRHGGGGALWVRVVVDPARAAAYAERLEDAVRGLSERAVDVGVLERVLRRERGRLLLERAPPESRAAAVALELALGGRPGNGWPASERVTRERVRAAAEALGAPARAVVGPRTARETVVEGPGTP